MRVSQILTLMPILICSGIVFVVLSFIVGLIGCWNRSKKFIMSTGILLILAGKTITDLKQKTGYVQFSGLSMSVAMLLWHYVAYSERYTLDVEPYYKSWEPVSNIII